MERCLDRPPPARQADSNTIVCYYRSPTYGARMRRQFLIWFSVVVLVAASGAPYFGYLWIRNKILAHYSWVEPDDYINMRYFGLAGKLPNMVNQAIRLANPNGTVYLPPGSY